LALRRFCFLRKPFDTAIALANRPLTTSTGKLRHNSEGEPLLTGGNYIKGLSGMTCVLPSWAIRSVLDLPELKQMRASVEDETEALFRRDGYPPEPEH